LPADPWIAALLTSHNRRQETLASLAALADQRDVGGAVTVYLVDAGSTDGTAEAVAAAHPTARITTVGDDVFWNAGMRLAMATAVAEGRHTHLLWLNDDTRLDPDALVRLLDVERARGTAIVAGAVRDPDTGELTYGGVRRQSRGRPLNFSLVPPDEEARRVETMNGNVVLIPAAVIAEVGLLDAAFSHGMGDYDYGLRAGRRGIPVWMAPGTVGSCRRNPTQRPAESVRAELARQTGVKHLPPRQWMRFARRWAGPLWPLYAASPYVRRSLRALRS
jgi:GT2 family glycosyltransferase